MSKTDQLYMNKIQSNANKNENCIRVQVYLTEEQRKWLKRQAFETDLPMSKIVREIIQDFRTRLEEAKGKSKAKSKGEEG